MSSGQASREKPDEWRSFDLKVDEKAVPLDCPDIRREESYCGPEDLLRLREMREDFAAGYLEEPRALPVRRWSRAVRRRFETQPPTVYEGTLLYPAGPSLPPDAGNRIVAPAFSFTWEWRDAAWRRAVESAGDAEARRLLEKLRDAFAREDKLRRVADSPHHIGGWGYTHSIPNYGRVLREGLDAHAARVETSLAAARAADDAERVSFYAGLADVLAGVRVWHARLSAFLAGWRPPDSLSAVRRDRLLRALAQVPFRPARDFLEAVLAYNFVFYMDDCDNPGRIDQELQPFLEAGARAGRVDAAEAALLMAAFCDNVRANNAWSAAIGGTRPDGGPAYNDVTLMMLDAARGRFRPNLELRVRRDMPDRCWDAALEAAASGAGNPAFYNEEGYLRGLREAGLALDDEDLSLWNGGGCTETMVHGRSNVGSIEAGLLLPLVLQETMQRRLADAPSFEAFLDEFRRDIAATIAQMAAAVNLNQQARARWQPQPMRSLLIDDCIERGIDFNAGGARHNWSVINVAGLSNVADSLAALREVVFERAEMSGGRMLEILATDFRDEEAFRRRMTRCPRFGNDIASVDELAAGLADSIFDALAAHRPWRGGRFLPACIMFTTYADAGARIAATPDGRRSGEPLADSIGPAQGRDTRGPTAALRSVTRLPLRRAVGTPVLNLRFPKSIFARPEDRAKIRALIEAYFAMGGMQAQLTVADRAELEDALVHPDRHEHLIVRIGGFSAYFNSLSDELKRTVIERTETAVA
jgi:formate C-acetyltransferase